ncbi:unnamed protein product [Cylicostephanus goldi]|uniref:Uncharacterized protein n=1 Tax=Cylicostephanus goldi TaxID=71465 RepID=A0A3P7R0P9_CYLGO|nr:unnamed protein product [Cylicostephanus goldi]
MGQAETKPGEVGLWINCTVYNTPSVQGVPAQKQPSAEQEESAPNKEAEQAPAQDSPPVRKAPSAEQEEARKEAGPLAELKKEPTGKAALPEEEKKEGIQKEEKPSPKEIHAQYKSSAAPTPTKVPDPVVPKDTERKEAMEKPKKAASTVVPKAPEKQVMSKKRMKSKAKFLLKNLRH